MFCVCWDSYCGDAVSTYLRWANREGLKLALTFRGGGGGGIGCPLKLENSPDSSYLPQFQITPEVVSAYGGTLRLVSAYTGEYVAAGSSVPGVRWNYFSCNNSPLPRYGEIRINVM